MSGSDQVRRFVIQTQGTGDLQKLQAAADAATKALDTLKAAQDRLSKGTASSADVKAALGSQNILGLSGNRGGTVNLSRGMDAAIKDAESTVKRTHSALAAHQKQRDRDAQ